MSSIAAPQAATAAAEREHTLRFDSAAFARVLNRRSVAVAFYMVLALVASSTVTWAWGEGFEAWFYLTAYLVRQFLVSAACVLLAASLGEALMPPAWAGRSRYIVAGALIAGGAAVAAWVRMMIGRGDLGDQWLQWYIGTTIFWSLIGALAYWLFVVVREEERVHAALGDARREEERLAAQATEAQLSALQAQIEPHFLFNSLATAKRLYETDAGRGREMMQNLIAYFRAVLPSMRNRGSALGAELDLVRSYLRILKLRMGERLQFSVDCERGLADTPLPPMWLSTLVENAIKHGLTPLPEGGRIDVSAKKLDNELRLQVADTGRGFVAAGGSGVGLANMRQQLQALYGGRACLQLRANQPRGVIAEICIPVGDQHEQR